MEDQVLEHSFRAKCWTFQEKEHHQRIERETRQRNSKISEGEQEHSTNKVEFLEKRSHRNDEKSYLKAF